MAVPKRKQSKQRSNTRYANWKLAGPTLAKCPACGELKASHNVCPACGNYKGTTRVEVEKK